MSSLVRTFQLRLPRGPHETVLGHMAEHLAMVERHLHVALTRAGHETEAEIAAAGGSAAFEALLDSQRDADGKRPTGPLQRRKTAIKSTFIAEYGISARHFNSLLALLEGRYDSVREADKARLETLQDKRDRLQKKIASRAKKIAAFARVAREVAERAKLGKGPTKAQAKQLLSRQDSVRARFVQHQQKRRARDLAGKIARLQAEISRTTPRIVFGGSELLRARERIGKRDLPALVAWRKRWEKARAGGFLALGSKDETAGCQTCVGEIDAAGRLALRLRLPDAISTDGNRHLHLRDLDLPAFGREEVIAALMAHRVSAADRRAISYRFTRDADWPEGNSLSAWRICITIDQAVPEITSRVFERRLNRRGEPGSAAAGATEDFQGAIGVDINPDHLAWAAIDRHGNPVAGKSGMIALPLRGKSAGHRATLIGNAARDLVAIAVELGRPLVLEQLDFRSKKREMAEEGAGYARMLSAFAYASIQAAIRRRALRFGVELVDVNPAWTSLIGRTNFARRYGLSGHVAAAVAIARRAARCSERVNYIHGSRGRHNTLPTQSESRRHVWRQWALVRKDEVQARRRATGSRPAAGATTSSPPLTPDRAKGGAVRLSPQG